MPTVTFTPSETDLIEANKLWLRTELRRRGNLLFFLCGAVIFAALASHIAADAGIRPRLLAIGGGVILWLAGVILILGVLRLQLPRRARKSFARNRVLHDAVKLSWSQDGLSFETERGHSQHDWDEFPKWAESEAVFIIFHADRLFHFIPKRALSVSESDELRSLLR